MGVRRYEAQTTGDTHVGLLLTADCLKGTAEGFSLGQGNPHDPTFWLLLYDPKPLHRGYIGVILGLRGFRGAH